MYVRPAAVEDLQAIMAIYDIGRRAMRASGNLSQWINGYPSRQLILDDISAGNCFVICEPSSEAEDAPELERGEGPRAAIRGVFMFALGEDPTYAVIEDGEWLNSEPYGVIHRISSDGKTRGILAMAVAFALEHVSNVRIDTHADNAIMQAALAKAGFTRCGIIYCDDGSPRIAFQLVHE